MYPSSQNAYTALQDFNKTRRSSSDVLTEAQDKYGVGGIESRTKNLGTMVGNLQTAIDAVDPSVTGRTSGSLVTEAQRSALVNRERTPLVKDYNTTAQNLNTAQGDLNTARSNAGAYANSLLADQESRYKGLTDAYNVALAAEAEQRRREEADRAFNESVRQYNESQKQAAAASSGYNLGQYFTGSNTSAARGATTAATTDPIQQVAYNDVATRIQSQSDDQLRSDYAATLKSANYGNTKDKLKVQLYHQLRPDLFTRGVPSSAVVSNKLSY